MTGRQIVRALALVVSVSVLLGTGFLGLHNAITDWSDPATLLQRSVIGGTLIYAVIGLIGGFGVILRRQWAFALAVAWAIVVTYVGTAAVIAYTDAPISGALYAAAASALVGSLVALATRVATNISR